MMKQKLFEDYFDSIFREANILSVAEYKKNCKFFEINYGRLLPVDRNASILDVGCGTGQFLYYLKQKKYSNIFGVDISSSQIEFCKKNITKNVQKADVFDFLAERENSYDVITANDLIEHIPKNRVVEFLSMIYKKLNQNGIFLLKCPNMSNPFSLNSRYKDFTHECGFTDVSLYQVLYLAGFRKIEVYPSVIPTFNIGGFISQRVMGVFEKILKKMFWWQGYVAPRIMSPLLIMRAKK